MNANESKWVAVYKTESGSTMFDYCRLKKTAVNIAKQNNGRVYTAEEADRLFGRVS